MNRILIIEDDLHIAAGLKFNLEQEGYQVTLAPDGESGLKTFETSGTDLVVLDWMLPDIDGMTILRQLRRRSMQLPILVLTARGKSEDMVEGLDNGADDYLTKPFDLNVLLARIRSLLRSRQWLEDRPGIREIRFGDVHINLRTYEAAIQDRKVQLSFKEAMIMKLFWEKRNRVVSREELLQKVWGIDQAIQSRTVDNFIVQLRKIFEENPKKPRLIQSIHGQGYKFSPPESAPKA